MAGNIAPTRSRRSYGADDGHRPPKTGRDRTGARWRGTSRLRDPLAHRASLGPLSGDWRAFMRITGINAWRLRRFEAMTVAQLRAECDKRQVTRVDKDRKKDLVGKLMQRHARQLKR